MIMRHKPVESPAPAQTPGSRKVKVFVSYAHEDLALAERLLAHLRPLELQQHIELWYDGHLAAGANWKDALLEKLDGADIVIAALSNDFLGSEFVQNDELPRARERLNRGEVRLIPVLMRESGWKKTWLASLEILPRRNGSEYAVSRSRERALADVEAEVRRVVEEISSAWASTVEHVLRPAQSNDRRRFHFRDFDLRVYRDGLRGPCVEVLGQDGERGVSETVKLEGLRAEWMEAVRAGGAGEEVGRRLGRALFEALFPRSIRRLWLQRQQFEDADTYLRLRLDVEDPVLAALPWELMHADRETNLDNYLASSPRRPLTRFVRVEGPEPGALPIRGEMKVLGIAAGDPELETLRARLQAARASVRLDTSATTTPDDLRKRLKKHGGYHVLHFEGLAAVRDDGPALLLPRARGGMDPVFASTLARAGSLRLLVLIPPPGSAANVAGMLGAARAFVAAGVPAVVVMQGAAPRRVVAAFTEAFYTQLDAGLPLELCVSAGRRAILGLKGAGGAWALPALFSHVSSGMLWERLGSEEKRKDRYRTWLETLGVRRAAETPGPGTPRRIPNNLLRNGALPVLGRKSQIKQVLSELCSTLDNTRVLVNIVGEEGSGRSALGREVARRCVDLSVDEHSRAFDSVIWISTRDVVDAPPDGSWAVSQASWTMDDLYLTVGATLDRPRFLGVRPEERMEALEHLLRESRHLLVLDDVDRVLDGRVRQFLERLGGPSKVVMVSAVPVPLADAERRVRVVTVPPLHDDDAERLLQADALGTAPRRRGDPGMRSIVGRAGGMPFVLRWAAGYLRSGEALDTVLARLDEARGAPLVDHCLRISLDGLSGKEHELLRVLALLPQPARPELLGAAVKVEGDALQGALQRLVHLRLVRIVRDPQPYAPPGTEPPAAADQRPGPTYVIRSRLRRYALAQLEPDEQAARRTAAGIVRHMHTYVSTHHQASPRLVEAEVGNVFWAVRQARALGEWAMVVDFRNMLHDLLFDAGYWNQVLQIGEWAVEAGALAGRWKDRAWSELYPVGRVHFYRGDYDEARRCCVRAMRLFRQLPRLVRPAPRYLDPERTAKESPTRMAHVGMASAERHLGRILAERGELEEARLLFERGLRRVQRARPRSGPLEGHLHASLAYVAEVRAGLLDADAQREAHAAELAEARQQHWAALKLYEDPREPDPVGVASSCNALARLALGAERYGEAERLLFRALTALEERPAAVERWSQAKYTQALLAERRGNLALAERQLIDAQKRLWEQPLTTKRFDAAGLAGIAAALTRVAARLSASAPPPA